MHEEVGQIVVVKPRAPKFRIVKFESKRANQVQI
jgi:hypothetical protein